ncbi:MAG: tyrosine--tRNA ligase [Acidimicrobiales bacterium]
MVSRSGGLAADLVFRRLVHQVTDPVLPGLLDRDQWTVYAGFDPSAPSLHVGNLLQLCILRRFQQAGHRPIALAGGATGMIGDPGGKTHERSLLTTEELESNLSGIRHQLSRFLDLDESAGPGRAFLLDNAAWLGTMSLVDFLRQVGKHFTVNQMVAKESVRSRLERPEQGISYTEFSYMLLQAYDFLRLFTDHGCRLQVGGSDQWGNITLGVELIRRSTRSEAYGLTTPLVTKADGTKFGKTESGTVWLDATMTSPYHLYQFFLQSEDATVGDHLRFFTFLSHEEISDLDAQTASRPDLRAAQRALARSVCTLVHGPDATAGAERASAALFGTEIASLDEQTLLDVFEDAPSIPVPRTALVGHGVALTDLMVRSGLVGSKGEARRAIAQGGAYVNNVREPDSERVIGSSDLLQGRYVVLRRGRRDHRLVRAE